MAPLSSVECSRISHFFKGGTGPAAHPHNDTRGHSPGQHRCIGSASALGRSIVGGAQPGVAGAEAHRSFSRRKRWRTGQSGISGPKALTCRRHASHRHPGVDRPVPRGWHCSWNRPSGQLWASKSGGSRALPALQEAWASDRSAPIHRPDAERSRARCFRPGGRPSLEGIRLGMTP
jgi:hypothetical protein